MENLWVLVLAFGVPTAITGVFMRRLEKRFANRDKKREEREKNREELDRLLIQNTSAALSLGEATARAVQSLPNCHCNGDMSKALEYATKVKNAQKDFVTKMGVHYFYEE